MEFVVPREQFAADVDWVSKQLPTRLPIPILGGMRWELAETSDTVIISTFDFDKVAAARIRPTLVVQAPGSVIVPARKVATFLTQIPKRIELLEVRTDSEAVTIATVGADLRLTVALMNADEYPAQFAPVPSLTGTVPADAFAAAVDRLAVAAGTDDTVPTLTGALLTVEEQVLESFSTDRYRAVATRVPICPAEDGQPMPSVVVLMEHLKSAARALRNADRIWFGADDPSDPPDNLIEPGRITFSDGQRSLTGRLVLDPEFPTPKLRDHFASRPTAFATVPVDRLIETTKIAASVAAKHTPVRLVFEHDRVTVEAFGEDGQHLTDIIPASLKGADTFRIAYNPHFLLAALKTFKGAARFGLRSATKPSLLSEEPSDDLGHHEYQHLLMPVRLDEPDPADKSAPAA